MNIKIVGKQVILTIPPSDNSYKLVRHLPGCWLKYGWLLQ